VVLPSNGATNLMATSGFSFVNWQFPEVCKKLFGYCWTMLLRGCVKPLAYNWMQMN